MDDPTLRRCTGFARTWGMGGLTVVNLYALRSPDPAALWATDDPIGPDNDHWLRWAARDAGLLIGAWGANARPERITQVLRLPGFADLQALGVTKAGQPRHPLYLRGDAVPAPWRPERAA